MPNWVYSTFTVTGPADEISRFRNTMIRLEEPDPDHPEQIERHRRILDFGAVIPCPSECEDGVSEQWAVKHWGTKWPGLDVDVRTIDDTTLWFQFSSPWDFPTLAFKAIAKEFPLLKFSGSAYEENHYFKLKGDFNGPNAWKEVL